MNVRRRVLKIGMAVLVTVLGMGLGSPLRAQTIMGTLMEKETSQPISLGLITLITENGDTIATGVTNSRGEFSVDSPEPGSFLLVASAFGFKDTTVGLFELGVDGEMTVEFRIATTATELEGLIIDVGGTSLSRNRLITSGFVERANQGLGHFITPVDIENSFASDAIDLFRSVPGLTVDMSNAGRRQTIQMLSQGGTCSPIIYVDGVKLSVDLTRSVSLSSIISLQDVAGVEIYRRAAEIPLQFGLIGMGDRESIGNCGVVVFWTKQR